MNYTTLASDFLMNSNGTFTEYINETFELLNKTLILGYQGRILTRRLCGSMVSIIISASSSTKKIICCYVITGYSL